jgi:hypothetical protein
MSAQAPERGGVEGSGTEGVEGRVRGDRESGVDWADQAFGGVKVSLSTNR